MKYNFNLFHFLILSLLCACKPNLKQPTPESGIIDVSKYIAIGGSLTSGFADGALYFEAQQNSMPAILAKQFELIGGGVFNQPLVSTSSNGLAVILNNTLSVTAKSILGNKTDCLGNVSLSPIKITANSTYADLITSVYSVTGFNNLGIPDSKSFHLLYKGYGNLGGSYYNPFFQRICSNSTNASVVNDAVNQNPTFFTLQTGWHDVLSYALSGGTSDNITSVEKFKNALDSIVNELTKNGAKGAVANIPSIRTLPYFNTIVYNALKLDVTTAENLSLFYANLDSTKFYEGNNGFIIMDSNNSILGFRQAVKGELILLNTPLDSIKCNKMGSLIPIPNRYSLTLTEINQIESAIMNYNSILKNICTAKDLAYVDVNSFFDKIKSGFIYNGISVNANFVSGGFYSLDGLNLTPRGNALLTNEFIKAINEKYKSTIPEVDAAKYRAVIFP